VEIFRSFVSYACSNVVTCSTRVATELVGPRVSTDQMKARLILSLCSIKRRVGGVGSLILFKHVIQRRCQCVGLCSVGDERARSTCVMIVKGEL
jgi:hypothetical protein